MKILLITHYFPPEIGAPQARLFEMAKTWVEEGHQVAVVTGFPNHPTGIIPPEYRGRCYMTERIDGIEVHRNWIYATPNEGFVKKTAGHISFMFSSVFLSLLRVGRPDLILVSSPTFFSVFSAWFYSKWKMVPFVFDVRDLWPAAIVELGVLKNRVIIRVLEGFEHFFYRQAAHVVVVTESFKEILIRRGISGDKISFIPNGVDTDFFRPLPKDNSVARRHGLSDRFVVAYMGAHGLSHALENLLTVAGRFQDKPEVLFLFVGEGAAKSGLQKRTAEMGLANVVFLPGQPKQVMPEFWAAADVGVVPLKHIELFKGFIPSKMFEIMAAERPVAASLEGEAAAILERSGGALVVPPEDVDRLESAILELYENRAKAEQLGKAGRGFVERYFSRPNLARTYLGVFSRVLGGKTR